MDLYHVLNRGVDGRNIFQNKNDYHRFIHDLWEFNDTHPASHTHYHHLSADLRNRQIGTPKQEQKNYNNEKLVNIHGWCLMKNHYHLLLSECVEGGLVKFIRKLNVGYANYFNLFYERKGALFQGRTKKILIESDAHFLYILHYLHLNPLDFHHGSKMWREGIVQNPQSALTYLEQYKWSSYLDYIGKKNFPSVLTTSLFKEIFPNYSHAIVQILTDKKQTPDIKDLYTKIE